MQREPSFRSSHARRICEPLDGRGAARRARDALDAYWTNGRATAPRRGSAGCRESARSPTASARSIGAAPGSVFLGPNVSVLQAALATCIDFRGERNEVVYEALQFPSLTYVWREWERYGAVLTRRGFRRRTHDSDRTHRRRDHRAHGDRRALARVLRLRRGRRRARDPGALPQRRRAALRRCVSNDRRLPVRRDRSGISTSSPAARTSGCAAARAAAGST